MDKVKCPDFQSRSNGHKYYINCFHKRARLEFTSTESRTKYFQQYCCNNYKQCNRYKGIRRWGIND
ncbi:hypothetical protein [Clostridium sporogenes]|uniref:hypothetical protein n=1 Tax=Clostridium sporogenes TaxID=1509 RepID=UPI0022377211|nr:hypothetical protein [Clostridium sporogenes]MCW6111902.1 hypothetical protein [Clostridium sporogenes]